jgi:hypothetical protein
MPVIVSPAMIERAQVWLLAGIGSDIEGWPSCTTRSRWIDLSVSSSQGAPEVVDLGSLACVYTTTEGYMHALISKKQPKSRQCHCRVSCLPTYPLLLIIATKAPINRTSKASVAWKDGLTKANHQVRSYLPFYQGHCHGSLNAQSKSSHIDILVAYYGRIHLCFISWQRLDPSYLHWEKVLAILYICAVQKVVVRFCPNCITCSMSHSQ